MATVSSPRTPVFNVPNQLTAARLVLAIVLFFLIAGEFWLWCSLVFAVAAFTDWLDGYLARRQGLTSTLGRVFDPLVDKVLICGAYIFLLGIPGRTGLEPWMVTVVVARELIITGMRSFFENRGVVFGADWLGKIKMGLQCAALFGIFFDLFLVDWGVNWETGELVQRLRDGIIYAMIGATALSGLQYLWRALQISRADLET
ncbi:MAG TPA: CDP-diacylglycerol--glycerol-3-phosphate 3-phosphatidyltransferase [Gemmataceae bacterium]|jgi:CDP-diacylglycerol--glycerol-3-phosphate 3-phosphatidyltransferase|nr:CDP-diacylglycerol--glycerol-3-phosphate 3-phosphatidyltransferase [Gemmataceae bacterium]